MRNLLAFLVLATAVSAQTNNVFGTNELIINGNGFGGTSCMALTMAIGTGIATDWNGLPNSPILLAIDATCAPGTINVGPNNIIDLPLSGAFQVVLDGTGIFVPGWLSQWLHTDATGYMGFNIPNAPSAPGLNYGVQGAFFNPGYAAGFQVSAAYTISTPVPPPPPNLGAANTACNPTAINTGIICDDCFVQMPIGFSYTYYGVTYTDLYIGSNGYVTFGAGDSTYFETVSWFLGGPARISTCFDDHAPFNGGTITWYTDNVSTWEVCFNNVQEYYNNGPNTHKTTAVAGGIIFDYDANMTINDCIVGLSPGNNIGAGVPTNIGAGGNTFTGTVAPYQEWDGFLTNFHLKGYQVIWTLDATGTPVAQN